MNKLGGRAAAAFVGLALGGFASHSNAGTLVFTSFTLDNPATTVREGFEWTNNTIINPQTNLATSENPRTGSWAMTWDGTPYASYCIEPTQALRFNTPYLSYSWNGLTPTNNPGFQGTQLDRINKLYESSYDLGLTDSKNSAAFQLALWEILFDSSLDLSHGYFSTSIDDGNAATNDTPLAVKQIADAMLAGLDSRASGQWNFSWLSHDQIQDQLIAQRVPVPGTAALFGLGLLGFRTRRMR